MEVNEKEDRDFVRALARGLAVIESFDERHSYSTLSDIARRTSLSRGTTARLLYTLEKLGYVRTEGRHVALTPRALRLGFSYLSSQPVWRLATPYLDRAASELGQPVAFAVLDEHDVVYTFASRPPSANLASHHQGYPGGIGARLPAFCTAVGRVLLSGLSRQSLDNYFETAALEPQSPKTVVDVAAIRGIIDETRQNGFGIQDEEIELGFRAIAVPVRNVQGEVIGAVGMTAVVSRFTLDEMRKKAVPVLEREARNLEGVTMS